MEKSNTKLNKVYKILRIILIVFILFSMIKSCAKAAQNFTMHQIEINKTESEIIDALVEHFNLDTTGTFTNRMLGNVTFEQFKEITTNSATNPIVYDAFYFNHWFNGNANKYASNYYKAKQREGTATGNYGTADFSVSNYACLTFYTKSWQEYNGNSNIGTSNNNNNHSYYVLLKDANGEWYEYSYDNFSIVNAFMPKYEDNYHNTITIQNITYYNPQFNRSVTRWYIGNIVDVEDFTKLKVYYQQYDGNTWTDKGQLQFVDVSDGHAEIYFYNPTTLYNQAYRIYFTYENNTSEYYYYYFTPYGTNANSGDLPVYTGNDNNNGILENQTQQENQDFWKNTYNALFTLSSGDVKQLYDRISGELMPKISDKSDMQEELELLNNMQNAEPRRI